MSDTFTTLLGKRKADESILPSKSSKTISPILASIIEVIRTHKSSTGTSLQKILKDCSNQYSEKQIKNALKKFTTEEGNLVKIKNSYAVTGEIYEDTKNSIEIEELQIGNGDKIAGKGDQCTISYIGTLENNSCFDKSNNFNFVIGGGDVIKGFDLAVSGMKIGGKRKVTIPPELGYGKRGSLPEIPPNSTLKFQITLKDF